MNIRNRSTDQSPFYEIRNSVLEQMRGATLALIQGLFLQEVEEFCGAPFSRKGVNGHHRRGFDPGRVMLQGQRIQVRKPRVRKGQEEVELRSYAALQGFDLLQDKIMKHLMSGVSSRDYEGLLEEVSGGLGLKKSSVSQAFVRGSRQALDEINGRNLSSYTWASLMMDGIEFAGSCVVVVMGITCAGEKLILGLKKGDTENAEVCKDLIQELVERGFPTQKPFLFVLDGSKALPKECI